MATDPTRIRLRIVFGDVVLLGLGKADLLEGIRETGSNSYHLLVLLLYDSRRGEPCQMARDIAETEEYANRMARGRYSPPPRVCT